MFSCITLQNDQATVVLDGSGVNVMDPYGVRWVDLEDATQCRIQYEASADTPGSSVAIQVYGFGYLDGRAATQPSLVTNVTPLGPTVGQTSQLCVGDWRPVSSFFNTVGDMQLKVRLQGTPNASCTVYFVDLQFM